jgi:hypothetical protein
MRAGGFHDKFAVMPIQTAMENNLKPRAYLEYVFEQIQHHGMANPEAMLP